MSMRLKKLMLLSSLLVFFGCKKDKDEPVEPPLGFATIIEKDNVFGLWYMDKDGASFNRVFNEDLGISDHTSNPAWSSDGRKIYFIRNGSVPGVNGIYRIKPNGEEMTAVYTDNSTQTRSFYQLIASDDDQHIVFSFDIPRNGRRAIEIYRMCPCGQRVERLTTFEIDKQHQGEYFATEAYAGSISKDAKKLYLCQSDASISGRKDVHIYSLDLATPDSIKLITTVRATDVEGCTPSISPDGQTLLFSVDGNINTVKVNGSGLRQLGQMRGYRPTWDRNGDDFYFSSFNIPNMEQGIYKANFHLTEVSMVSRKPGAGRYCGFAVNK